MFYVITLCFHLFYLIFHNIRWSDVMVSEWWMIRDKWNRERFMPKFELWDRREKCKLYKNSRFTSTSKYEQKWET